MIMNIKVQLILNSVLIVVAVVGFTVADECDKDKVKG
jgi:hypothetical protein